MPFAESDATAPEGADVEEDFMAAPVAPSATTFEHPMPNTSGTSVIPDRKVTIYVSGSTTGRDALKESTLTLSADDIKAAIGLGKDQYVPALTSAKVTHFFNPTQQRLGLRIVNSKNDNRIVQDSAHARNPRTQKMEGFTAVLPSVTQGNLNTPLIPEGNEMGKDEAEVLAKWRGLKTVDLTDGIMETRVPNVDGTPTVVKYDVPLVRPNGEPQPVAFMLERNKEAFPGFRGKGIKQHLHEFEGQQYYSVPPKYVHYIVGSMQEQLIEKQAGLNLESDVAIKIMPLSPILSDRVSTKDTTPLERMVALELEFKNLDMSNN